MHVSPILAVATALTVQGGGPDGSDVVESVRADVLALEALLFEQHANAFWMRDEESLALLLTEVEGVLDREDLAREEALVQLLRVVAFPGDGHTQLDWSSQVQLFGDVPVRFAWFGDELRVVQGAGEMEPLVGAVLEAIEDVPIADALTALRPFVTHANESGFRIFSTRYLRCPGVLNGVGLTSSPERVTYRLRGSDGSVTRIELEDDAGKGIGTSTSDNEVHSRGEGGDEGPHRFSYLEAQDAFHVRVAAVVDAPGGSLADFTERLFAALDEKMPRRVVIDLRGNGGGNNFLVLPFAADLLARPRLQRRGVLVVLTDEQTFSAAINFCNLLQMKTDAVFAGRSPGDSPYGPGDARPYTLPSTGMRIRLSSEFWSTFPGDRRRAIEPDIPVDRTYDDFAAGRDPLLELALSWEPGPAVPIEDPGRFVGRFAFSPGRILTIEEQDGELRMEVSKLLYSGLRPTDGGRLVANVGFTLEATPEGLRLDDGLGHARDLPRVGADAIAPIDAVYAGELDRARELYAGLREADPAAVGLLDNNLATEAVLLFYRTRDREQARSLAEIACELNPERGVARRMLDRF